MFFLFQAEDGIRAGHVTGVQTCALPIFQQPQGHARRRSAVQMGYLRIPEVRVYPAPRSRIDLLQGAKLHTSESGSHARSLQAPAAANTGPTTIGASRTVRRGGPRPACLYS